MSAVTRCHRQEYDFPSQLYYGDATTRINENRMLRVG
jgi:hypothetical protein